MGYAARVWREPVYLIDPGFVKTPLTEKKEFKMRALRSAAEVADEVIKGLRRGDFETSVLDAS